MEHLPRGPEWGERSVIMPANAIPWSRAWQRRGVAQNIESVSVLHERVPDGVNGLRIATLYAMQDNSSNPRAPLTVSLYLGDIRNVAPGAGSSRWRPYLSIDIAVQEALMFPVYWVVPPGEDFDITLFQAFVAAPQIWGYSTGWYF